MHVGAIVNAANTSLLNGCKTGEAKITGAYHISYADHIIHTVGSVYSGKESDAQRFSCMSIEDTNIPRQPGKPMFRF